MPTDLAAPDPLIDALVADLVAVRPRRWTREVALLLGLVGVEILVLAAVRGLRPDLAEAVTGAVFWWKSGGLMLVALLAAAAALVSLDPATTAPLRASRLWTIIAVAVPLLLGLGWIFDAGDVGQAPLLARLDWRAGLDCLVSVVLLSLPPVAAIGLIMRRGAATQPARTARAAGLSAAAFGAFVFAFHCPHDDPLYVAVWYGGAVAVAILLARIGLPRLTRW